MALDWPGNLPEPGERHRHCLAGIRKRETFEA